MTRGMRIAAVCVPVIGLLVTVGPWAVTAGRHRGHDDLWLSVWLFTASAVLAVAHLERPVRGRWWRWAYAVPCVLCGLLAGYNLPAKLQDYQTQVAGKQAIDAYFADMLFWQIVQFLIVGAAGVGGVLLAAFAPRTADPPAG